MQPFPISKQCVSQAYVDASFRHPTSEFRHTERNDFLPSTADAGGNKCAALYYRLWIYLTALYYIISILNFDVVKPRERLELANSSVFCGMHLALLILSPQSIPLQHVFFFIQS